MYKNLLDTGGANFNVEYNCGEFNLSTFMANFRYFCKIQIQYCYCFKDTIRSFNAQKIGIPGYYHSIRKNILFRLTSKPTWKLRNIEENC